MSSTFELWYPVKPFSLNQGFGVNPAYYAQFLDSYGVPEKGHMGLDMFTSPGHGQLVYASHDGLASFKRDSHGGEGVYIRTTEPLDYKDSQAYFETIYWHLIGDTDASFVSPIPLDGKEYPVKIGDLIGYANNTGAPFESSGNHLHFGLRPLDHNGAALEPRNGFGGCIDPTPYFTRFYAQDQGFVFASFRKVIELLKSLLAKH